MASLLSTPWAFTVALSLVPQIHTSKAPEAAENIQGSQPVPEPENLTRAGGADPSAGTPAVVRPRIRRLTSKMTAAPARNPESADGHSPPEIGSLRRGRGGCLFRLEDVVKLPDRGVCIAKLGAHSALSLTTPQPGSRDVRLPATMRNNTRKLYFLDSCLAQTKARGIIDGYEQKKRAIGARLPAPTPRCPFHLPDQTTPVVFFSSSQASPSTA